MCVSERVYVCVCFFLLLFDPFVRRTQLKVNLVFDGNSMVRHTHRLYRRTSRSNRAIIFLVFIRLFFNTPEQITAAAPAPAKHETLTRRRKNSDHSFRERSPTTKNNLKVEKFKFLGGTNEKRTCCKN